MNFILFLSIQIQFLRCSRNQNQSIRKNSEISHEIVEVSSEEDENEISKSRRASTSVNSGHLNDMPSTSAASKSETEENSDTSEDQIEKDFLSAVNNIITHNGENSDNEADEEIDTITKVRTSAETILHHVESNVRKFILITEEYLNNFFNFIINTLKKTEGSNDSDHDDSDDEDDQINHNGIVLYVNPQGFFRHFE